MTSIIIPISRTERIESVQKTIDNLRDTARGDIEIICVLDGADFDIDADLVIDNKGNFGERVSVNRGAKNAEGKYIFKVDAHCRMSRGWDFEMAQVCRDNDLIVAELRRFDDSGKRGRFVGINAKMREFWLSDNRPDSIIESMSLMGCGWMMRRESFKKIGMFDETLSRWGAIGPEFTFKIDRIGGRILVNTRAVCWHRFGGRKYKIGPIERARKKLLAKYGRRLWELKNKWLLVRGWECVQDWESYRKWIERYVNGR